MRRRDIVMTRKPRVQSALIGLFLAGTVFLGCGRREVGAVNVVGSTSIQPFAEMLAQEFNRRHMDINVEVQGGGSTAGLQAVTEGIADIGTCSRSLKKEETGFTPIVIARDGLAVVIHPDNPLEGLTKAQIRDIFSGQITRWSQVGGLDREIRIISREEGSGTREAFTKLVMDKARISRKALTQESNGSVKELLKNDPSAIGYMSLGLIGDQLKALAVEGVPATSEEVLAGRYPLVRPFLFTLRGQPKACVQLFIEFVLSPEGQRILKKEGLVGA
jgi:phosphate transport system substrate-binding protein